MQLTKRAANSRQGWLCCALTPPTGQQQSMQIAGCCATLRLCLAGNSLHLSALRLLAGHAGPCSRDTSPRAGRLGENSYTVCRMQQQECLYAQILAAIHSVRALRHRVTVCVAFLGKLEICCAIYTLGGNQPGPHNSVAVIPQSTQPHNICGCGYTAITATNSLVVKCT
jgi:hypothetical protein